MDKKQFKEAVQLLFSAYRDELRWHTILEEKENDPAAFLKLIWMFRSGIDIHFEDGTIEKEFIYMERCFTPIFKFLISNLQPEIKPYKKIVYTCSNTEITSMIKDKASNNPFFWDIERKLSISLIKQNEALPSQQKEIIIQHIRRDNNRAPKKPGKPIAGVEIRNYIIASYIKALENFGYKPREKNSPDDPIYSLYDAASKALKRINIHLSYDAIKKIYQKHGKQNIDINIELFLPISFSIINTSDYLEYSNYRVQEICKTASEWMKQ